MEKISILVPCCNVEKYVRQCLDSIKAQTHTNLEIICIDDGSKDKTFSIIQQEAISKPLLCPITKPNGGHGATILYGYRYALDNGADYVFQTAKGVIYGIGFIENEPLGGCETYQLSISNQNKVHASYDPDVKQRC